MLLNWTFGRTSTAARVTCRSVVSRSLGLSPSAIRRAASRNRSWSMARRYPRRAGIRKPGRPALVTWGGSAWVTSGHGSGLLRRPRRRRRRRSGTAGRDEHAGRGAPGREAAAPGGLYGAGHVGAVRPLAPDRG